MTSPRAVGNVVRRSIGRPWRHPAALAACVLAGLLFAITAREARGTDLRPGERGDLTTLVREEQARAEAANARVRDLRARVRDSAGVSPTTASAEQVERDSARAQRLARAVGLEELRGPALTVVLDDAPPEAREARGPDVSPDDVVVHEEDVQGVVNALWAGGAEAMQLMDQRVISTSAVRCVGTTLLLHGRIFPPPYRITAIGPVDAMRQALDTSPQVQLYREYVDLVGLRYEVTEHSDAVVPAYDGLLGITAATVAPGTPGGRAPLEGGIRNGLPAGRVD